MKWLRRFTCYAAVFYIQPIDNEIWLELPVYQHVIWDVTNYFFNLISQDTYTERSVPFISSSLTFVVNLKHRFFTAQP